MNAMIEKEIGYQDIVDDVKEIQTHLIKLSYKLYVLLSALLKEFIHSFQDLSYSNIKRVGLKEVLFARALRFFNLPNNEDKQSVRERIKAYKPKIKRRIKKVIGRMIIAIASMIYFISGKTQKRTRKKKYNTFQEKIRS
ncbi:MAG: hypothetical protein M9897_08310 [Brumimicrobium sp.]|nr:hypothetical protein [Brumimicrobium sp.]